MRYRKFRHLALELTTFFLACPVHGVMDHEIPPALDEDRPRHFAVSRFA